MERGVWHVQNMLQVRELEHKYGAIRSLKGVSLEVNQGEVVALIGANGSRKDHAAALHFRHFEALRRFHRI